MKRNSFRNNVIKSNESKFKRAFEHGTKAQRTQGHDKRWRRHWVITKRPTQILHASATASSIDNQLSKAIALGNRFSSFGRVSLSDNRHHRGDSTSILFNWTSEKTVEFHSSHVWFVWRPAVFHCLCSSFPTKQLSQTQGIL